MAQSRNGTEVVLEVPRPKSLAALRDELAEAERNALDVAQRLLGIRFDTGMRALLRARDDIRDQIRTWEHLLRIQWDAETDQRLTTLRAQRHEVDEALKALEEARDRLYRAEKYAVELPASIRRQQVVVERNRALLENSEPNRSWTSESRWAQHARDQLEGSERRLEALKNDLRALTAEA